MIENKQSMVGIVCKIRLSIEAIQGVLISLILNKRKLAQARVLYSLLLIFPHMNVLRWRPANRDRFGITRHCCT